MSSFSLLQLKGGKQQHKTLKLRHFNPKAIREREAGVKLSEKQDRELTESVV